MSLLALTQTTPPMVEPVTLLEMKQWLRVNSDYTSDDGLILSLITACRQRAESYMGRSILTQSWSFSLDFFPSFNLQSAPGRTGRWNMANDWYDSQVVYLPRGPLVSLDAIDYIAPDGSTNTLDPSNYTIDGSSEPARIFPAYNSYWPTLLAVPNAVTFSYTAGETTCPEVYKLAIKLMVAAFYDNPADFSTSSGPANALPLGSQRLLAAHRITPFDYSR